MSNNIPPPGNSSWSCSQTQQSQNSPKAEAPQLTTLDQLVNGMQSLGTGADAAFLVYAMQIKKMDQNVTDALNNIQDTSSMRDAMSKDLAKLRELNNLVARHADGGGGCNISKVINDWAAKNCKPDDTYQQKSDQFWKAFPQLKGSNYSLDKNGNAVRTPNGKGIARSDGDNGWTINTNDVKTAIDNLSDDIKKLDSNREIKMIMLNQMLNKKGNAISQLTNMIKQAHNNEQAIINNLK
jgi:hypothetical protein